MLRDYFDGRRDGLKRIPCRVRSTVYEKGYRHGIRKSNVTESERIRFYRRLTVVCGALAITFLLLAVYFHHVA